MITLKPEDRAELRTDLVNAVRRELREEGIVAPLRAVMAAVDRALPSPIRSPWTITLGDTRVTLDTRIRATVWIMRATHLPNTIAVGLTGDARAHGSATTTLVPGLLVEFSE